MNNNFSELALVKVEQFNSKTRKLADENGVPNVYLKTIGGKFPLTAIVMAGTVATNTGLVIGNTYFVETKEKEFDEKYGRQFSVTCIGKPTMLEIIGLKKELCEPTIVDTTTEGLNKETKKPTSMMNENALNGQ